MKDIKFEELVVHEEHKKKNVEGKYPQYVGTYPYGVTAGHIFDLGGGVFASGYMNDIYERKSPYRIESYVHSDSVTENKIGVLVKVTAETDFAVKTEQFKNLCRTIARLACGLKIDNVSKLLGSTDLGEAIEETSKELKEKIEVVQIVIL